MKLFTNSNKHLYFYAIITCLATLSGFFGKYWWVLDLASHFRVQYFILLLLLTCILLFQKKYKIAFVFLTFTAINFSLILPLYLKNTDAINDDSPIARAMLINLRTSNNKYKKTINAIKKYNPDFLIVEELNTQWLGQLSNLTNNYPYYITAPQEDNFGMAFYSKIPPEKLEVKYIGMIGLPSVAGQFNFGGNLLTIIGTHPVPPIGNDYFKYRNEQLAAIPNFLKNYDTPILLLGDLNFTPWSYYFKLLIKKSALIDSSKGKGVQPTWPTMFFPFLIPIDHCLHSQNIIITDKIVGDNIGSDHYPLVIDFQIKN